MTSTPGLSAGRDGKEERAEPPAWGRHTKRAEAVGEGR